MDFNSAWIKTSADLFVNLSAGWFGVAVILPIGLRRQRFRRTPLLVNVSLGIIFYVLAITLRQFGG